MSSIQDIQYFKHESIDKARWDECIRRSANGRIYALSAYLDCMSPGWEALVLNDYATVMPLPAQKKWGIGYLSQPFLTAQLGVFGNTITVDTVNAFVQKAASLYRFIEINLNSGNLFPIAAAAVTERRNYILPLNQPYEILCQQYNENTRRNIKKAQQMGCVLQKGIAVEKLVSLAVRQMQVQGHKPGKNVDSFRALYNFLQEKQMAEIYGMLSPEEELLASAAFFFSHSRAYYILVGNSPEARTTGASHALIDAFIQEHAGKNLLLDFEGSDIPTLAQFYSSFGATNEPYPAIRINNLPFYLKWMK